MLRWHVEHVSVGMCFVVQAGRLGGFFCTLDLLPSLKTLADFWGRKLSFEPTGCNDLPDEHRNEV